MFVPPAPASRPALAKAGRAAESAFEIDPRLTYDLSTKYAACIPFTDVDAPPWIRVGNRILTIRRAATLETAPLPAPIGPLERRVFPPRLAARILNRKIDTKETPVYHHSSTSPVAQTRTHSFYSDYWFRELTEAAMAERAHLAPASNWKSPDETA